MKELALAGWVVASIACGFPRPPDVGPADGATPGIDAAATQFLSCYGLPPTCGVTGHDSCCNSFLVPGGSYDRGYDVAGDDYSGDTNSPATVADFRLDKYKVTVGRFRMFVAAGMGTQVNPPTHGAGAHARTPGSGWDTIWNSNLPENTAALLASRNLCASSYQTWTDLPAANEHRPMNCVTWYEAMAFCAWDGGYLPTEAEWNYAAAGGDEQRAYPWSSPPRTLTLDPSYASYGDGMNNGINCFGDGLSACTLADIIAVGTKPLGNGRWQHSDLAGTVWEWTLDWHSVVYPTPCTNCANLIATSSRVIRGAGFKNAPISLRTGSRFGSLPSERSSSTGFRCARSAP